MTIAVEYFNQVTLGIIDVRFSVAFLPGKRNGPEIRLHKATTNFLYGAHDHEKMFTFMDHLDRKGTEEFHNLVYKPCGSFYLDEPSIHLIICLIESGKIPYNVYFEQIKDIILD